MRRTPRASYVNIAATMTTTNSAPITHSAVDENVHSYMPGTSLLVSSNLDARYGAKVYKTCARHDRVFRVKMRRTAINRAIPHAVRQVFSHTDGPANRRARTKGTRKTVAAMW
jgi:hypothetical protein